jgi:capsule polysaccharide export protein KpsE/RkpR
MTKKEIAERSNLVDELGNLETRIAARDAAMAPDRARVADIRAKINGWTADLPAEQAAVYGGRISSAMVTACKNVRTLNDLVLRKVIGDDRYLRAAQVSLGTADILVKEFPEAAGAISTKRSGGRTLTVFLKAA